LTTVFLRLFSVTSMKSLFAYNDIDFVMANQRDLVTPVKQLKTVGVVKG